MTFNSVDFLIFLPVVLIAYFVLPRKLRPAILLCASYFFYMYWNPRLVVLILFTTAVSYFCSLMTERTESKKLKKLYLVITLIACLGVLFFFKYYNFAASSVVSLFGYLGKTIPDPALELMLPVGISFYTFQTLSYVIDVYRGNIKAEKNFFWYALFVSFFPQLVAGPIERPENLLPQLKKSEGFSKDNFFSGLSVMSLGFFKKVVVADFAAVYVNAVYNDVSSADGGAVFIATLLFSVQIYCDFSGYTDIATGCARMMGIRLMKNFDRPYSARNIKEFWARWHISLSTWFRDYLYIPLGGNRRGRTRFLLNLFAVFLASGLWHGAKWTFVIWGALHGLYRIIGELFKKPTGKLREKLGVRRESPVVGFLSRVITYALVLFSWIFFRANSTSDLVLLLGKLFSPWENILRTLGNLGIGTTCAVCLALAAVTVFAADRYFISSCDIKPSGAGELDIKKWSAFTAFVWAVIIMWTMFSSQESTFIYFQF